MDELFESPALEPVAAPVRRDGEDQRETFQRVLDEISGVAG